MKKVLIILFFLIAISVIAYFFVSPKLKIQSVKTFSECVASGFPVQESYPERCVLPDSRSFTNPAQENVFCPMDVKQCPNGDFVGRIPPRCEFKECPK